MSEFKSGLKDGIPICLGYFSVAFAFGIFCVNSGLSPLQATLISIANVTSAGQLAAVPIMTCGGSFVELALAQLVINLRYALMSISISQKLDRTMTTPRRLIVSFINTDEIFAVASGHGDSVGKDYMYGLILTPFFGWAIGTLMGAVAGNVMPQSVSEALGIAIYGMFIAIIIPVAKKNKNVLGVVFTAVAMSLIFFYVPALKVVSSGFVIIICAVVAAAVFAVIAPVKEN
mgnify:CR=1 FL=1